MGEWLYYNFAAGSFHSKKLCNRLYLIEIDLLFKNQKIVLCATIWGLTGNICTPSIAHWKVHGQLPIRHNWTFFHYLLRLRRYKRKPVEVGIFRIGWVTYKMSANFQTEGASSTNHCWCQKTRVIALSCCIKISTVHCLVLSQRTHVTDGRIDRQNYSQ